MFANLQHETSQAREASEEGAGASGAGARVRGLWRHMAFICCMFAFLQHETSEAHEALEEGAGASGAEGASSRPVASRGVHVLHVDHGRDPFLR